MLDPVPWLIGGGAVHSAEVARTLGYVAANGASGVVTSTDLAVTPLASPGPSVHVGIGAFSIVNTYPGAVDQAYIGRNPSVTDVAIAGTSGSPRSDMIVLRIDDPDFGGTVPSDVTVGPYVKFAVISNVSSTATEVPGSVTYPAIPIARIDIPASTTNITGAMIVDIRKLISPKTKPVILTSADAIVLSATVASPGQSWPKTAGWDVFIPTWATHVYANGIVGGIKVVGNGAGKVWIRMGASAEVLSVMTDQTAYDSSGGDGASAQRLVVAPAGKIAIPASLRGTTVNFSFRGYVTVGTGTARGLSDAATSASLNLLFAEEPTT